MAESVIISFESDVSKLQPAIDSFEKLDAAGVKTVKTFNEQAKSSDAAHLKIDQLSQSVRDLNKNVLGDSNTKTVKEFTEQLTASATQSKSLKAQLIALKQELALMEQSGQAGSRAFVDLSVKAGKLQDQIGDTAQRVRILASDTKNLQGALSVATGLAGAFATVQGATALFGKSSEDLQKALLKVQAALAILNGLQAVAATLNKDSAASVVLLSTAQKAYTLVVGTSTGAMKAFRLALAATGIGLLIIGIIALVENFDKLKAAIGFGVNPALTEMAVKKQKLVDIAEKLADSSSLEERRLRALGATDTEILNIRLDNIKKYLIALGEQQKVEQAIFDSKVQSVGKQQGILNSLKLAGGAAGLGGKFLELFGFGSVEEIADQGKKIDDITGKIAEAQVKILETQKEISDKAIAVRKEVVISSIIVSPEELPAPDQDPLVIHTRDVHDHIRQIIKETKDINAQINAEKLQDDFKYVDAVANSIERLLQFNLDSTQTQISDLEDQHQRGIISDRAYRKKLAEFRRKEAIAEKEKAIFSAVINTARAIVEALPNVVLSVASGIAGAIEIGIIAGKKIPDIPQFAGGTELVTGGIRGKDSVYAKLMPGERVVPTDINEKLMGIPNAELPNLLNAFPETPYISDATMSSIEHGRSSHTGIDYDLLGKSVAKYIAQHPRLSVNIDERGFEKRIYEAGNKRKSLDDSYKWSG